MISTVSKSRNETTDEYYSRKLSSLRRICCDKRVLFVVDNFTGMVNEELSQIIDCGYKTIIITRKKPATNSFPAMELLSISDMHELLKLVAYNLGHPITSKERSCFEEIITLVQGHTLVVELIARQIASGRLSVNDALKLINQKGFSRFSSEKIGNYKDGKEVYDTLGTIITDLFNSVNLSRKEKLALKVLSLFDVRGLETELFEIFFSEISKASLRFLNNSGWIYCDRNYHVHPVIAQTVKGWCWLIDDVSVMDYHKRIIDIYNGMANVSQIRKICYEAKVFKSKHPKHIIKAMYNDILGCYYDVLLDGAYIPHNKKEDRIIDKMTKAAENAIKEIKRSCDKRRNRYIIKYHLSLASILIRSYRDAFDEAKENIDDAFKLIKKYKLNESEELCCCYSVLAWYYTRGKHDINMTEHYVKKALKLSRRVFKTELEIIDCAYIPSADCLDVNERSELSVKILLKAIEMCDKHSDSYPYIDKKAELISCLIDVYHSMGDLQKCRRTLRELDMLNNAYREQGIQRDILPENRKVIESGN